MTFDLWHASFIFFIITGMVKDKDIKFDMKLKSADYAKHPAAGR